MMASGRMAAKIERRGSDGTTETDRGVRPSPRGMATYAVSAGVSVTTAKTHLNGLFAKLGTNRQADLVRTIVTDPALRALS